MYVRSQRAGERVLRRLRGLHARLKLPINEAKSAVASVYGRSFLGFTCWTRKGEVRRAVSMKALARLKDRIRRLTRRTQGRSIAQAVEELRKYLPGWKAHFALAQTPRRFSDLDERLRHGLRPLHLAQWRRGPTICRELGASKEHACRVAANSRRWWRNGAKALHRMLSLDYFDRPGRPRLS